MLTALVLTPTVLLAGYLLHHSLRNERRSLAVREEAVRDGLIEPASLHPVIDQDRCIGCGSCVVACPEERVLGLIHGKAELIGPTHCIGHGACRTACPADAIDLVFGTQKRGIDIPHVEPDFQTDLPGIFIAGELGGMGLIRNAIEQGRQAIDSIRKRKAPGGRLDADVVIVGAGPAGFSASLAAKQHGLRYVTLEQEALGGTVAHYPRGKVVMTAPVQLPLVGKVKFGETTKERLLEFWQGVEKRTGVQIRYHERLEEIQPHDGGFLVKSTRGSYTTRSVLLTIGRRGTPRKLGAPGEELPKVSYRLIDPEQYRGQAVLVVGGGDSALEAATSLAEEAGTRVCLSYRSAAFSRAKEKNRQRVSDAEAAGRLCVLLESTVKEIGARDVRLEHRGQETTLDNDAVIVCVGGILPTPFLRKLGITVETKHGTA